jgi:hypothetical protein
MEDPLISFTTPGLKVCLRASFNVLLPSRSNFHDVTKSFSDPLQRHGGSTSNSSGIFLQGFTTVLNPCFQLPAVPHGQILVLKSVFHVPIASTYVTSLQTQCRTSETQPYGTVRKFTAFTHGAQ